MAKYRPEFGHKSQASAWNGISKILNCKTINEVNDIINSFLTSKGIEISKHQEVNANRVQNNFNEFKKFIK